MRDGHKLDPRWSDYAFTASAAPFPVETIQPPGAYPDAVYLSVPGRGTALVSGPVDEALASQLMRARLDEAPYRLPEPLTGSAPYVLPVLNDGRLVFNGTVVGMRGDPLPPGTGIRPPIALHVARYFDAQCSNELCTLQVSRHGAKGHGVKGHGAGGQGGEGRGEDDFDPRIALLTTADGRLRTLAESTLADCVGISTIAFTADNALVVTRPTRHNAGRPHLLAPSGSGSLDPCDLSPASAGQPRREESLQEIAVRGMERELREETGIRPDEILSTRVTGFARWLERGAKPEFFGVTALSATARDLREQRHLASDERLYTDGTLTLEIDLPAFSRELAAGGDVLGAPSLPREIKEHGSLPLLLALRAVARLAAAGDSGDNG